METLNQEYSALATVALRILVKKDRHYSFPSTADAVFKEALDLLFAHPDLDPKEELEALLRLGWLLETKYESFEVSDQIVASLSRDMRALSALGIDNATKLRELRNQFNQFASVEKRLSAPVFGDEAPKGSLKLSSFLQPGREIGPRRTPRS
jgi:hypothetical protein